MENNSAHYDTDRRARHEFIHQHIGEGNIIDAFVVDRGHLGGEEIHSVTDTAVIIIHNKETNKLITKLIARPEQLRRLYHSVGREPPKQIMRLAYKHNACRYNEI